MDHINEIKQLIQQNKVTDLQMLEIAKCLKDNCATYSGAWYVMNDACFELSCVIESRLMLEEQERQDEEDERKFHRGY